MKKTNEIMNGVVVSPRGTGELDHPYLEETEENEKKKKSYYPFVYDLLDITLDDSDDENDDGGPGEMSDASGDGGELEETSAMGGGGVAGSSGGPWTREDFIQERKIRKFIQERIKKVYKQKLVKKNIQEAKLRFYIQNLIKEATTEIEDAPHENTGINILADLLKKIIPTLETDYKTLTTNEEQRRSFRAHITNAVKMSLNRLEINKDAENPEIDITEALDINVEDEDELELDNDEDKFIDIEDKPTPEDDVEEDVFTIPGEDTTGRNLALQSFDKIENQITDAYSILSNEEDKKLFNDYLITNLKLYFDKFENELSNVEEPTTDEYEEETASNELEL